MLIIFNFDRVVINSTVCTSWNDFTFINSMKNQLCRENVETQPVYWNFSASLTCLLGFRNFSQCLVICTNFKCFADRFFADKQGADLGRLLTFRDV